MLYLMIQSTHFYLQLYGNKHMVRDHLDNERKPTAAIVWAALTNILYSLPHRLYSRPRPTY